ncbi:biotin/lipoyl-binding protein [Desulfobacterales bacterium HSG17]|nr:biotin/lipoyl-binding protein [Desulfobacterales bacterium HSG17]
MKPESGVKDNKLKRLLIIVPIILAIIIVWGLKRNRKGLEKLPLKEAARKVRVINADTIDVIPRVTGYGHVEPGQVWQIVPEVSGKIIEVNSAFKQGNFIKKGAALLRIDPAQYELASAQMEAGIESIRAQIAELDIQEKNYKISLAIEKKALMLNKKNMDRNKQALKEHTVSSLQYEQAQLSYQAQKAKVQNIKNSLTLIPANRKSLKANLALNQAKLDDAKLNLKHTSIIAPFNCRITDTNAEIGQFVQKGQNIASADGTAAAEITVRIPLEKMVILIKSISSKKITFTGQSLDKIKEIFDLKVKIHFKDGNLEAQWDARFARADATIDAKTRTLGIIVVVDEPYKKVIVGVRPPLARNMFCEVEIRGRPVLKTFVIPRSALHNSHVYIVNSENRLERRKAEIDFSQADFHVIKHGFKSGEQIVVSDLIPAVENMLLKPEQDKELAARLIVQATGQSDISSGIRQENNNND